MRETHFIQQNQAKWEEFEQLLEADEKDPNRLSDLLIQVTDDLSYARTYYPNRSIRVYLNDLAQRIQGKTYRGYRSPWQSLWRFWLEELPTLLYQARQDMRIVFWVFLLAIGIGALSTVMDPEFPKIILSEDYLATTEENIRKGDPMAVYKDENVVGMLFFIALNNLRVALISFLFGTFFGVGTLVVVLINGIMVGTFQSYFIVRGLYWESVLTIWIHGVLELAALVVAGAAGLTLGRSMAFPGTFSRLYALQRAARRGLKILLGIAPIVLLAAIFESVLTRQTEASPLLRGGFILLSLVFVWLYLVWLPRLRGQLVQLPTAATTMTEGSITPPFVWQQEGIKSSAEIFRNTMQLYRKHLGKILASGAVLSLAYGAGAYALSLQGIADAFSFSQKFSIDIFFAIDQLFFNGAVPGLVVLAGLLGAAFTVVINRIFLAERQIAYSRSFGAFGRSLLRGATGVVLILVLFVPQNTVLTLLLLPPGLSLACLWIISGQQEQRGLLQSYSRTLKLVRRRFFALTAQAISLLFISLLLIALLNSGVVGLLLQAVRFMVVLKDQDLENFGELLLLVLNFAGLLWCLALFLLNLGLHYFNLVEMMEAKWLRERISTMAVQKHIKGLVKE